MDPSIQKALNDKLYDRRKGGALELERLIRESLLANNHDRIRRIVDQLCRDYAYAVHQPYARNGGLIGLAAASIALGPAVAQYLEKIVPPVLACFTDQDARVRYYACESMYNIAKTSKGEILVFFNEIFEALAKLAADSELSVKNGAELLDRLIKDIISDSATSYVSVLLTTEEAIDDSNAHTHTQGGSAELPTAFSLQRFIPLLQERIFVLNPFTRMFLVSWITLLDSIPDLELISFLPSFLGGLFRFLNDSNQDVVTSTQHVLERFLDEVKLVARVKRGLTEHRKVLLDNDIASSSGSVKSGASVHENVLPLPETIDVQALIGDGVDQASRGATETSSIDADHTVNEDWVPGQDVHVDHPKLLEILVTFLRDAPEEHIQLTALRWVDSFFEICPEDLCPFVPRLLNQVLPALSSEIEQVRQAGGRVNSSLMEYIMSLPDEMDFEKVDVSRRPQSPTNNVSSGRDAATRDSRDLVGPARSSHFEVHDTNPAIDSSTRAQSAMQSSSIHEGTIADGTMKLDYEATVNALTLQFLNENEATRVAALSWLLMLQRKAPRKVLAAHDGTFPALLKTLSDTSDTVVTRDLQLLSQISKNSDDSYFTFFMVNLLKLFCTDRRLLETRGNLIIRQLCLNLSPERIYRTMADCLEKDEVTHLPCLLVTEGLMEQDVEFASIMVQNLNNNLITAPELSELRRKLRNWEIRDGQTFFVALFRSWCHNAVATISLCLLAQAYEQAYNLLQIFADIEMTVSMLIQIDKLVQLLESPVFTYLRLQLLEPDRFPYLYRCLYGILMLLPQSAAFAALKNRLNSVSAIGYLHIPGSVGPARPTSASLSDGRSTLGSSIVPAAFERANRLKLKDDASAAGQGGPVKWVELLDKFRAVQDKARRASRAQTLTEHEDDDRNSQHERGKTWTANGRSSRDMDVRSGVARSSDSKVQIGSGQPTGIKDGHVKGKFGAAGLVRLTSGVRGKMKK